MMKTPKPNIFDVDAAHASVNRLLSDLRCIVDSHCPADDHQTLMLQAQSLDKIARTVSSNLKSLTDLETYNERVKSAEEKKAYTRYEDLPPLSPADEERFRERVKSLFNGEALRQGRDPFYPKDERA
jgi:broad-specificity NMP kinase